MVTVDHCILGNGALHDRFFATTEILAKVVSCAPRGVRIAQLEEATGRTSRELGRLCQALARAGLLRHDAAAGKWQLTCDPCAVTLEDVFRCVLSETPARKPARASASERAASDVDVLVMQAMLAINQSVFQHLRQFSLDRLKISAAGMFPAPRRALHACSLDDDDPDTGSGREAAAPASARVSAWASA